MIENVETHDDYLRMDTHNTRVRELEGGGAGSKKKMKETYLKHELIMICWVGANMTTNAFYTMIERFIGIGGQYDGILGRKMNILIDKG